MTKKPLQPSQLNQGTSVDAQKAARQKAQADRMAAIKSRGLPLGGAEEVKIPPLDAEPMRDEHGRPMTMHQQAEALQDPRNPLSPYYRPELAMAGPEQPDEDQMDPQALREKREGHLIKHRPGQRTAKGKAGPFGGIVPPEQRKDPNFRPGIGSAYMANQPGLAQPQRQKPGRPQLSEETIEGLEALKKFQQQAETAQKSEAEKPAEKPRLSVEEEVAAELGIENVEAFLESFRKNRAELDNEELRQQIEKRIKPLDIVEMIEEGEARQDVPIVRGKFVPTFRTVSGDEDLQVKRRMYGMRGGETYAVEFLAIQHLTCGLYSINNHPLPSHLGEDGDFNEELFKKKLRIVCKYPTPMIASLSVNFKWFDDRTRKLFIDLDELKNG